MAGIYDVNAAIDKPNFLGSFRQGQMYGQQMKQNALAMEQAQQASADRNALRGFAPQIIAGDPAAYEQAAAINPEAAQQYQDAGDSQMRRLKGAIDFMDQAKKTGNQQAVEAAWQQVRPYLNRMSPEGVEPPMTFAEAEPKMEEARARIAMAMSGGAHGNVQSVRIGEDGFYYNVYRDGRIVNTGVKANPNIRVLEQEGTTPYGVVTSGGVAGSVVPLGGGSPTPAQPGQQFVGSQGMMVDGVELSPAEAAAFKQALEAQSRGEDFNVQVPPTGSPSVATSGGSGPVRTPTAGERAAAQAAARRQVELETLPAELGMRSGAATEQALNIERGRQDIERESVARVNKTALSMYEAGMDSLRKSMGQTTTGPIVGRLPALTATQQAAEGTVAAMAPILKGLFRQAGEGTFTDRDQELLLRMIPTRTDLPEAREAKLENIDRIVRAKLSAQGNAPSSGTVRRARNPQTGEVLVLRNGAWVAE